MEIPIKIIQASDADLAEMEALQASSFPAEKQQPSHILEESIRKCADTFLLARDENQLFRLYSKRSSARQSAMSKSTFFSH